MSDVHHRHHTFSTTYLNSPCGRLPVPTGVPRKFIPLPREPRNLQSRSRLYRGIFLNFNPDPAGKPAGLPRDIPAPAPVQNSKLDAEVVVARCVCVCVCHSGTRTSSVKSRKSNLEMWLEESSSDDDFVDSDDADDERRRADQVAADTDHWLVQKLIRYVKVRSHSAPGFTLRLYIEIIHS